MSGKNPRYMVDTMLKFKHFPSMPPLPEDIFWEDPSPEEIRDILPSSFPEWLEYLNGLAGLATLSSVADPDALEEICSWGYGEDGFFYSFLAKGSRVRNRLELSNLPFFLEQAPGFEFYDQEARGCLLGPIRIGKKLSGFILVEVSGEPRDRDIFLLGLLCQKISWALGERRVAAEKPSPIESGIGEILFRLAGGNSSLLEEFRKKQILRIFGPPASGRKTLAKWIHKLDLLEKPLVTVSVLPEQIPKLEKALADWEKMAQTGSLVLEKVEDYSLNQQRILYEYSQRKTSKCRLIFLENRDQKPKEEFVYFRSLLAGNSIELPAWKFWNSEDRRSLILSVFQEVREVHGRPDLRLSSEAIESLSGGSSYRNLEDVRNAIEEAVLNSGTGEIHTSELKKEGPLGVSLPDPEDLDLRKAVEAMERQKILLADKLFGGNQIRMAKALGISRGSLQYKLRNLGLG